MLVFVIYTSINQIKYFNKFLKLINMEVLIFKIVPNNIKGVFTPQLFKIYEYFNFKQIRRIYLLFSFLI